MPSLNWIGKEAVTEHHVHVPQRLLHCDQELSCGESGREFSPTSGNLLIEGDNLQALKTLLPFYKGRVKCITIDPPYNTGNEGWIYNDNVNSPQIRQWLGKVVDGEDLTRHDKWLCMMVARLRYHHELLSDDGAIFICIDDNEVHHLRALCDETFGARNFVANIVWQKRYAVSNDHKTVCPMHDHIIVYRKSEAWQRHLMPRTKANNKQYRFRDRHGIFRLSDYTCNKSSDERPNLYYAITQPNTGEEIWPKRTRVWAYSQEQHQANVADDAVSWGTDGMSRTPALKRYLHKLHGGDGVVPSTWWTHEEAGHNDEARRELRALQLEIDFPTPKPLRLVRRILELATDPGDIVLDSFAGSGTTGHAVMQLNVENPDLPPRRFVLVEIEPEVARPVTRERLKRAIEGYGEAPGLPGEFRFCHLGLPLIDSNGEINPQATWRDLAHFFYLNRFQVALDGRQCDEKSGFVGRHGDLSLFLLSGSSGIGVLDLRALRLLKDHKGVKIVVCSAVCVPQKLLQQAGIVQTHQAPYEVGS